MKTEQLKHFILTIVILVVVFTKTFGQRVTINSGVDTTDYDIKAIIALWTNYLKSNPNENNIKDSPFWADSEKNKYPKVDQLLNAISSDYHTYSMGSPTILYVKPKNNFFEIKTLFSWIDSLKSFNVLCITSVFAKKEKEQFKLYNALTINKKNWKTERIGSVTFHFPQSHSFDKIKANRLLNSIENLIKTWNIEPIPIDYYFAATYEEVEHLRGLDYSIGMGNKDKPSGMSDLENNSVFAGGLGENYFHEVVHIYLNRIFPKSSLVEGLAVFYGGSMGQDLKWHLIRLNNYLSQHSEINLNDLDKFLYLDNLTNPKSTIQGLLCYMANKNGGLDKLKRLMSYQDTYIAIEKEFGIQRNALNEYLRQQITANKN